MDKRSLLIMGLMTLAISVVLAFQNIDVDVQEIGVYTPTCIVYTIPITEQYGISASNYVFPIFIENTDPGFSFLLGRKVFVAKDSLGKSPVDYWMFISNTSEIGIWIRLPTITSSEVYTLYVFGCPNNPYPDKGNPASNSMFLYYNNFTGGGDPLTETTMGIGNSTTASTETVNDGTLKISAKLSYGDEVAYEMGTINLSSHPYVIVFGMMSFYTADGGLAGLYAAADDGFESDVVYNAHLISTTTTSDGFYMVTYHSDFWGPSFGGVKYYSESDSTSWYMVGNWFFYDGNYTTVYFAAYDKYGNLLSVTSTTVANYTEIMTVGIGLLQVKSYAAPRDNILYVDWLIAVPYWGWPAYSVEGVGYQLTNA